MATTRLAVAVAAPVAPAAPAAAAAAAALAHAVATPRVAPPRGLATVTAVVAGAALAVGSAAVAVTRAAVDAGGRHSDLFFVVFVAFGSFVCLVFVFRGKVSRLFLSFFLSHLSFSVETETEPTQEENRKEKTRKKLKRYSSTSTPNAPWSKSASSC